MRYLLKIKGTADWYATEEVDANSALHALADYVETRIPPPREYLIRVSRDEATMTSEHYTIEARPLGYDVWRKDWNDLSTEERQQVRFETEYAEELAREL